MYRIVVIFFLLMIGCSTYEFQDPTSAKINIDYKNNTEKESKSSVDSTSDRLEKLKELKQEGLLTNEEYEKKRNSIINEL